VLSPPKNTYDDPVDVSISKNALCESIYYTTNKSEPTTGSTFSLSVPTTIKATCFKAG
jgi:hypothetical protein